MYLLPFFRHPDYALHSGTRPILAIYSAHHFESQPPGQRRAGCNATVHGSQGELQLRGCTRAPFGCAAAQLYLQWYPHLATFLVPKQAHAYHTAQGSKLGYSWPRSDPCADADQHQHGRLARMLSLWQAMARQHGFAGLHVLGTLNHDNNAAGVARAAGGPDAVGGLLQFFPTALLSTRPGHWSHAKGFMKCARPTHPNNCTCFLNQLGEEGVETLFKASITAVSPSLGFARGAMPGWSSFPRGRLKSGWALCSQRSAEAYGELVRRQLHRALNDGGGFKALHARTKQKQATSFAWHHLVVVNAWNEWGEQAVVEPTVQDGDAMLAAHRLAVQQVEQQVNHRHSHDHSLLRHSTSLSATPSESPHRPAGFGAGQDRAQSLARRHGSTRDGQDTTTHLLNTSSYKQVIRALIEEYQCHSAYIDVGSNIGVQIRKLYEPSLYVGVDPRMERFAKTVGLGEEPTAEERQAGIVKGLAFWNSTSQVLPIFDEYFGRVPRCGVCAIGVEPNPRHSPRHAQVQAALRTAGFGALWLSATAADVVDGTTIMKLSPKSSWWGMAVNDVGASVEPASRAAKLNPKNDMDTVSVATVDLAELVKFVHGNLLRLPDGRRQEPQIVMKVDTEGAEYRLLPHLIANDALCLVNLIFLEWHPQPYPLGTAAQRAVQQLTERALKAPQCKTVLSTIDDETFLYDGKPLHETRICPQRSVHAMVHAHVRNTTSSAPTYTSINTSSAAAVHGDCGTRKGTDLPVNNHVELPPVVRPRWLPRSITRRAAESCLRGSRLLVSLAAYGDGTSKPKLDAARAAAMTSMYDHLSVTLHSLAHAQAYTGSTIDMLLFTSHSLPSAFQLPPHLHLEVHVMGSSGSPLELAGLYRPYFVRSVQAGQHDYYLVADYDINVTAINLEALCTAWAHLGSASCQPGQLVPTLLLYEECGAGDMFLPATQAQDPSTWSHALHINAAPYAALANPYQASWLLPAAQFRACLTRMQREGADFLATNGMGTHSVDRRVVYGGGWLFGSAANDLVGWRTHWKGLGLTGVIAMNALPSLLVHHQTNLYCQGGYTEGARAPAWQKRRPKTLRQAITEFGTAPRRVSANTTRQRA